MAIKIPSAAELGVGRRTPGAIPEGAPRPVPKIRTGVGLEIAQGLTQLAGLAVSGLAAKQAETARQEAADAEKFQKATALRSFTELNIGFNKGLSAIADNPDFSTAEKRIQAEGVYQEYDAQYKDKIPGDLQLGFEPKRLKFLDDSRTKFNDAIHAQNEVKVLAETIQTNEALVREAAEFPGALLDNVAAIKANISGIDSLTPVQKGIMTDEAVGQILINDVERRKLDTARYPALLEDLKARNKKGEYVGRYADLEPSVRFKAIKGVEEGAKAVKVFDRAKGVVAEAMNKHGNVGDFEVINSDKVLDAVRKGSDNPDVVKSGLTMAKEAITAHNASVQTRINANIDVIDEALFNNATSAEVYNSPEFIQLPGTEKKKIEDRINAYANAKVPTDKDVETALAVEAMTLPPNATANEILAFKAKVGKAVAAEKITPGQGRSIVSDAENATKIDPVRKEEETIIVNALKSDHKAGLMGEGEEADIELAKTIASFRRWSRSHLDADPVEFYQDVSRPYTEKYFFGLFGGREEGDIGRRVKEIEGDRQGAIDYLRSNNAPVTEANIRYVIDNKAE